MTFGAISLRITPKQRSTKPGDFERLIALCARTEAIVHLLTDDETGQITCYKSGQFICSLQ
jgi:hypothetical protein